jgi:hypothetical protein
MLHVVSPTRGEAASTPHPWRGDAVRQIHSPNAVESAVLQVPAGTCSLPIILAVRVPFLRSQDVFISRSPVSKAAKLVVSRGLVGFGVGNLWDISGSAIYVYLDGLAGFESFRFVIWYGSSRPWGLSYINPYMGSHVTTRSTAPQSASSYLATRISHLLHEML